MNIQKTLIGVPSMKPRVSFRGNCVIAMSSDRSQKNICMAYIIFFGRNFKIFTIFFRNILLYCMVSKMPLFFFEQRCIFHISKNITHMDYLDFANEAPNSPPSKVWGAADNSRKI